jgi:hypothetical protein
MTLTHEFLALMLGVRRADVSEALQAFENRSLVETARRIVNGPYGLRRRSCSIDEEEGDACSSTSLPALDR